MFDKFINDMRKFITILSAALCMISAADAQTKTGIVAHRGFWNCEEAGYAKNSVAALRCAQEAGFWGSEFDVNMTSDGVLLVYHDGKVDGVSIEENPYSEFKDFKIANGEAIPTIDQYLEQGKKYPETMLVYEMKPHSCEEAEDRFIDLTIAKLEEHGLLDPQRVMFISFSFHICQDMAEKLPDFTVQYLGGGKSPKEVKAAGINGIDYNYHRLNFHCKWIQKAHKLGMSTNAWTVDSRRGMKKMLKMGINSITTDNPLEARELIKELGVEEVF